MLDWRQNRTARRALERENAKRPTVLVEVPQSEWPEAVQRLQKIPTKVWRSRDFLVQAFIEPYPAALRLSICRTTARPDGRWDDQITWDELQLLKRQAGFGDQVAVEIFPPDIDVINVANMRHLWIMAHDLEFRWRKA